MTLTDINGKPIGDLPPVTREVKLDIPAIAQRAAIARSHPMESQRTAAKNLLIADVENLLGLCVGLHDQYEVLQGRHRQLLENASTSGALLAMILTETPEYRWSKAFVEGFEVAGGWILETDPADEDGWLLRLGVAEPIVSAEEQTDVSREADSERSGDRPALHVLRDEHDGSGDEPVDGDQHDG